MILPIYCKTILKICLISCRDLVQVVKVTQNEVFTAQKMKFSVKDFFSKYDQIRIFLPIWSRLQKKSLMGNFFVQWSKSLDHVQYYFFFHKYCRRLLRMMSKNQEMITDFFLGLKSIAIVTRKYLQQSTVKLHVNL